ncbi:class I SAM-dependent methyltransferase [Nocardia seriolae]|nr:class I SAM-dependent methyltransferase [Nocardia seriolae]MTJ62276.1 methyltransferase domain-containing protein [Nocardia seriolae]MTJ70801.1 methyltransferase domain-containing protein [Nocardia seriolae]MTJ87182.1 methyltransferase domain-containing protein [Nocardia seriolae]MTK31176.1 methyltransferase domain-containing protein [Nocardia seriolae]MTK40227.1 methyltransferase domain-containing protein [Nocardia seriolae]
MYVPDVDRWNHNIEYHSLLASAVAKARTVLDVGCGEGMLARRIRRTGAEVTGIDPDPTSIELARDQSPENDITYLQADFLRYPFEPRSFDGIVSIAALHYMDTVAALTRMRELLRPGGTLAVIGMARNDFPADLPWEAAALLTSLEKRLFRAQWAHPSPVVWPPPETYAEVRRTAADLLPGVHYRRHRLWRYSLIWTEPNRPPRRASR